MRPEGSAVAADRFVRVCVRKRPLFPHETAQGERGGRGGARLWQLCARAPACLCAWLVGPPLGAQSFCSIGDACVSYVIHRWPGSIQS